MRSDQATRSQAINPALSFIVQAPAGSGKTELLVQRFLNLLAKAVRHPEEIIAITFTRKAASEMRERIIGALTFAEKEPEPVETHQKTTWQLAKAALQVDKKNRWQLLTNPNRLRILTIDALCAMISRQMPLLSGFGIKPTLTDYATPYYRKSIIDVLNEPGEYYVAIKTLLLHFDNNAEQLTTLLTDLLAKREQWLPFIINHHHNVDDLKIALETSLQNVARAVLQCAKDHFSETEGLEIAELASFAATQLQIDDSSHAITACCNLVTLPSTNPEALPLWQAILDLLLTKEKEWRKSIDKRQGFTTEHKAQKKRWQSLLQTLREKPLLKESLIAVKECPPIHYTTTQWQVIQALMQLLPRLTAELHLQFQKEGIIDFIELTLGALRALGESDEPTDLALYLDYQIRHFLIDEFQDTSVLQFSLLQRLTQEWQPNEGKTLFLVGDPMQSIYRFRQAEVGLFLQAQQHGLGQMPLIALTLTQNFRSDAQIVHWINDTFQTVFPSTADCALGAIPYNASHATQSISQNNAVFYHASPEGSLQLAEPVTHLVRTYQKQFPTESIAILVRSRSQLQEIIQALNKQALHYQAVELETLHHRAEIRDLVALTRALLHPSDRIAWLAVLRAPWCGLTLKDIHVICQKAGNRPLWSVLPHFPKITDLSEEAQHRLQHTVSQLIHSLEARGRQPLSDWVQGTWMGLGGHSYQNTYALNNANRYFELLEENEAAFNLSELEEKLKKLYAKPNKEANPLLQLMTIHKSKGLEFDHVIIPELQKGAQADTSALLLWQEHIRADGKTDLLLAPLKATSETTDPIHNYLKQRENKKLELERARLLYVAATRAKKTLHLYTKLKLNEETGEFRSPNKGTFLELLWERFQHAFLSSLSESTQEEVTHLEVKAPTLTRLPVNTLNTNLVLPSLIDDRFALKARFLEAETQHQQSAFGIILHELLEQLTGKPTLGIEELMAHAKRRLLQFGTPEKETPPILKRMQHALESTCRDPRGQWILHAHPESHTEYALTLWDKEKFQKNIIDRYFVDQHKVCWIIDYKSATPEAGMLMSDFLATQKKYHEKQLNHYAHILGLMQKHEIKLGLYFPLCQGWIEWSAATIPIDASSL